MWIKKGGCYRDTTEEKYKRLFKRQGYVKVALPDTPEVQEDIVIDLGEDLIDFSDMTVKELKEYATDNNISLPRRARKDEIIEILKEI